ncbi:MAG TPA: BatD family protein [Candidatus Coprenecus stercoravium]|uniref:BatD family protein n=1 Tax=Candidatus Coprenecus stercoravium TaxID=2840735 RepID=A0A9D2GN74_9BACT|nr:BatD family protein [Candidatus Coprenecus stercoravium]
MRKLLLRGLLLSIFAVAGCMSAAAQSSFTADVPAVVSLGEEFRVVFTATGDGKVSDFKAPAFSGFEVLAGPLQSTSSSFQMINGKTTQSRSNSYTFVLRTSEKGKFVIEPASVRIGKETFNTDPAAVEVIEGAVGNEQAVSGTRAGDDLMLRMSVSKTSAVVGEPIVVTLKLYVQNSAIGGFEDVRFPSFDGFWSQEIDAPQNIQFVRENYDGQVYNSALIRRYMLLPQQTGKITVEPAEIVCLVRERVQSSGSRSIFDDFFDSYRTIRKRVATKPVVIDVAPLPAGVPASFTGGVGEFRMTAAFSSDSVDAHEAASLRVTVSGAGNINLISAPEVRLPADFESYDVKKTENITTGTSGASGTVTFEFPFIPRVPGVFETAPVELSYYDIKSGRYRTLSSGPLVLKVGQGSQDVSAVVPSGVSKQSVRSLGEDIRFIETSQAGLRRAGKLLVDTPVIYIVPAVILLLTAAAWMMLGRMAVRRADVAGTRNRKALKVAKARLRSASIYLKQNLPGAFYEELHKAVGGYISDKLMLPASELSRDRIEEELRSRNKDENVIKELFELMDACEYARYAPAEGSDAMDRHYRQAAKIISEIES